MALSRLRSLLLVLGLTAALPAQITYNTVSYHGVSHASHQASSNSLVLQGYRPLSLAVAGGWANSHYSAVWIQQGGPAWVSSHGMTAAQYGSQRTIWEGQGYRPLIVSASGSGSDQVFAAVYVNDNVQVVHSVGLSRTTFESAVAAYNEAGRRLVSCAVYGSSLSPLFAPVFEPDGSSIGWGQAISSSSQFNAHFAEFQLTEARPTMIEMSDYPYYLQVWRDDRIGNWSMVSGRTQAQLTTDKQAAAAQNLFPLCIAAGGSGSNARFSAIFVQRLTPLPRTLTHTNLGTVAMQPFDNWVDNFVQNQNVRNATLAVIKDGRLVYARGYGYAEAGHPASPPQALWRLGSIAKSLTGMLAHKVIQSGTGNLSLNTGFVNYLGISNYYTPGGLNVSLQSLFNHSAGLNDPPYANELVVAQWVDPSNPQLPCSESQISAWTIANTISSQGSYSYSNAGLTMAGQMVEQATQQSYMTALNSRLAGPLGVTFRRQQPLKNNLANGEVHYYPRNLSLRDGNLHVDLRRMAPQYCQRFWDSAGGVVGSAVDLARVVAGSFQIGADSPVFSVPTQNNMLTQRSIPKRGNSSNLVQVTDSSWHWRSGGQGRTTYWHNGEQDGFHTFCWFRTDGVGIVWCSNTDAGISGVSLENAADQVTNWPTNDLFPSYGLPSFPRRPSLTSTVVGTRPNLTHEPFIYYGENFNQITHVTFAGNHVLVPALSTAWANGYIRIISPTELHVFAPQGLVPGSYPVQAFSALGGGNTRYATVTHAPTFAVAAPDYVIGGMMPFSVYACEGALPGSAFVALGFSPSTLPSVSPGVVSLGIGNNFTSLLVSDMRGFSPLSGVTRWDFPGIGGWSQLHLQAAALVPNSINPFPVPTTAVVTVVRQ